MKKEEIILDAENKSLGRLATLIAYYLQGKHRSDYAPYLDKPIYVLIKNLDKARFSGKKFEQKFFVKHTGYLGHLKEISLKLLWDKNKLKVIQNIVKRMLPKNKLRERRLKRIKLIQEQ